MQDNTDFWPIIIGHYNVMRSRLITDLGVNPKIWDKLFITIVHKAGGFLV